MKKWIKDSFETPSELKAYIGKARERLLWLEAKTGVSFFGLTGREAELAARAMLAMQGLENTEIYRTASALSQWRELHDALDEMEEAEERQKEASPAALDR